MIELPDIKMERKQRKWTQKKLSELSDVALPTLIRLEKDISRGSVLNLKKVSDTFSKYHLNHIVYIMSADKIMKIGNTKDIKKRWGSVNYSDTPCNILHYINCGYWRALRLETLFKGIMHKFHERGEWYECSERQAIFILNVCFEALESVCPGVENDYYTDQYLDQAARYIEDRYGLNYKTLTLNSIDEAHRPWKGGRKKSPIWEHEDEIKQKRDEGMSFKELSEVYGPSESTIRRVYEGKE